MRQADYNGYKLGALKRRFKTGRADMPPGTFIAKANEMQKEAVIKTTEPMSPPERTAIMGAV